MSDTSTQWEHERAYFDAEADKAGRFDLDSVAHRYEKAMSRPLYPLEFAYAAAGDLRGKRVLDVGCGQGKNSLLFARWGAHVTGVDISERAISLCKRRASSAGLAERTTFLAMPFEQFANVEHRFDVVWSAGFLHHILDRLNDVLAQFRADMKDDGIVVMLEPVRLSPCLKYLRQLIPPLPEGTPDERPLEPKDMAKIAQLFDIKSQRLYGPLSRLSRRFAPDTYESSGMLTRHLSDLGYKIDSVVVNSPVIRRSAMSIVASLMPKR